jgi:predicted permease
MPIRREALAQRSQDLVRDVGYALRSLRRTPAFTAVAVLTIALGIGATAAVFTVVNSVLLRPLPYAEADRLVRVYQANVQQGLQKASASLLDFEDWRQQTRAFASMTAYQNGPLVVTGTGEPLELDVATVAGDFFGTLGAIPALGRVLSEDEDVRRAIPNVVISSRLWQDAFGGDPKALGRTLTVQGRAYTVVGVMPPEFRYPAPRTDVWLPRSVLSAAEIGENVRNQRFLDVLGRLRPGVTPEQGQSALDVVASGLAAQHPDTNAGWNRVTVVPLRTVVIGDVDQPLFALLAIVLAIVAIVCLNLANVLLARGSARAREMAVRASLGATRGRMIRQVLTESLVLAAVGGGAGLALCQWIVRAVVGLAGDTLPRLHDVQIDVRVIGFGVLLTLITGLAFGALPSLRAAAASLTEGIKGGRTVVEGRGRLQAGLVVAQLAMAVVLVIGAGLMARSFLALRSADPGFRADGALAITMQMNIAGVEQPVAHIARRRQEWIGRVAAIPGIVGVGTITSLPLERKCGDYIEFLRSDGTGAQGGGAIRVDECLVSSGYFRAVGIPLLKGTALPDEVPAAPAPIPFMVTATAARQIWPGDEPVGKLIRLRSGRGRSAIVVGVVGDVRQLGLREEPPSAVYFPQAVGPRLVTTLVARTSGNPKAFMEPIRNAIRTLDPKQPIRSLTTLEGVVAESIARDQFFTFIFAMFGALALVIASVGVYGLFAYVVSQRTREIGVRIALGAQRRAVVGMVVGQGGKLIVVGLVVGIAGALLVTRPLESLLYRTSTLDALTLTTVPAILAALALTACAIPAWRAARIDPLVALRSD